MKNWTKPQVPMASWCWMVSCIWLVVLITRFQVTTALGSPQGNALRASEYLKDKLEDQLVEESNRNSNDGGLEEDLQHDVEYEDDLDNDYGLGFEDQIEDDSLTPEDVEDMKAARVALEQLKQEAGNRGLIEVATETTTVVELGNQYTFVSHPDFGQDRYPNRWVRRWTFLRGPKVQYVKVYCPFFRTQWSRRCRKDKFTIFKAPFKRGIRRCGQIHGFYKRYNTHIRIVFKTNAYVRRAGFTCSVAGIPYPKTTTTSTSTSTTTTSTTTTFSPGCPLPPTPPPIKQVVSTCADILPGYDYCTCSEILTGLCLECHICTACDMEFFAVHDFSSVDLYTYVNFNCTDKPFDAASLTFGYQTSVKGYILCFPAPTHVTPIFYPSSFFLVAMSCPLSPGFSACDLFEIAATGRRLLKPGVSVYMPEKRALIPGYTRRALESLANVPVTTEVLEIIELAADLSTLPAPENVRSLIVVDTYCKMFLDGELIDLTAFTSLETLELDMCITHCAPGTIVLNSTVIQVVLLKLPNVINPDTSCVTNQASTPPGLPVINILQ